MKKFIKSIIKAVLTLGVLLGLICMTGENVQIIWSLLWLAEMLICGWALVKLFPEDFKEEQV